METRLGATAVVVLFGFAMLGGCASMQFDNYAFTDEHDVFAADFEGGVDGIEIEAEGDVFLEQGILHHRARPGRGTGWYVEPEFGDRAVISFDLMLGEFVNGGHPDSHINIYTRFEPEYARYCIMISESGIGWFSSNGADFVDGDWTALTTPRHEWHHFDFVLEGDAVIVFRDGKRVRRCSVPADVVREGRLLFESHQYMSVDNVAIREYGAYRVN